MIQIHHSKAATGGIGLPLACLLLFCAFFSPRAEAQLEVGLEMDKKTYMAHEPVTGVLTLINRAGRDLILDGKDGRSWLDYRVTDPRGQLISPLQNFKKPVPLILKSGVPHTQRVTVNTMYPMGGSGMYGVTALVYFPPLGRYFQSKRSTLNVVEGKMMWSQTVGVPQGLVGAGSYRNFALLTYFQGARQRSLYFRLSDADTGIVRHTFSLGEYIAVQKPQHLVDSKSKLHVLQLAGPEVYSYTVIDASGEVITRTAYRVHQGQRPELIVNSVSGEIKVHGGMSVEESRIPYEEREFRKISERPPGLPRI